MLSRRLHIVEPEVLSSEDYLTSAHSQIFLDDTRDCHGILGQHIIYKSKSFGDIELELADPKGEDGRKLFASYVWNASLLLAEFIDVPSVGTDMKHSSIAVKGERVLEVGAGTGLVSLLAAKAGAQEVLVSDNPKMELISALKANVERNLAVEVRQKIRVQAHQWGKLDDMFATGHAKAFTRSLCADCLWMEGEHKNLIESMHHFLAEEAHARVWVSAGLHTGRSIVAQFFQEAAKAGFESETIWERNVNTAKDRPWATSREEDITERKQWLVVAILKRKS